MLRAAADAGVSRFIHVSSLSAREPQLSDYGASKAASELLLTARDWPFSWTLFAHRPSMAQATRRSSNF
ncbi:hypothetical protein [Kordiimonas gwangyangensis]|uniref:hypothetical protein n=1 Tax=Kordiimonas gwangyangensis TaxID=288022 RepID=UPI0034E2B4FD